ncbi:hypothetical protein GF376_03180 [Candidatus Peregrinibacteria bacterium]|nr:hypothetical protein [Candidatus Peregrinibacteria bacterium]
MKRTLLGVVISIAIPTISIAQNLNQVDIYPTFPNEVNPYSFYFELKPGDSFTEYLSLTNRNSTSIELEIKPVDQLEDGFKLANQKQTAFGNWTTIEENKLTLKPQEYTEISFTTKTPTDVKLDNYSGGISVQTSDNDQIKSRSLIPVHFKVTENPVNSEKFIYSQEKTNPGLINFFALIFITLTIIWFVISIHSNTLKNNQKKQ